MKNLIIGFIMGFLFAGSLAYAASTHMVLLIDMSGHVVGVTGNPIYIE